MSLRIELDHLCVVLVNTRNPLNIGAAARAMSNFGFHDLRLVRPFAPSFREARSAVGKGASHVLAGAREYTSVAEAVADCNLAIGTTAAARRELQHPLRLLGDVETARLIHKHLRRGRLALLFGSERRGLSNQDFSYCHWLLRIPTREDQGSMNLGQAVAVCLYEIARNATLPGRAGKANEIGARKNERSRPASAGELERITAVLLDVLRASGYLPVTASPTGEEKIRRMVRRLELSALDAELLLGMLRQMAWKMREIG